MSEIKNESPPGGRSIFQFCGTFGEASPEITLTWTGDIRPLGYAELVGAVLHRKLSIPFGFDNAQMIENGSLNERLSVTVNSTFNSNFTSRAIGLLKGGWLPSALAADHHDTTVLPDRNVVSEIIARFDQGRPIAADPDFLDLFAGRAVRINPMLFIMEGNARQIPTVELMRSQLVEATSKLKAALPFAVLIIPSLEAAQAMLKATRARFEREQEFLVGLAPTLSAPVGERNMRQRWDEVLGAADRRGLSPASLAVLTALSSIAVPRGRSPAKRLLKFKPDYTEADAYNALSDLRSLEYLMYCFAMFPDKPTQICTADKDLACFGPGYGHQISIGMALAPALHTICRPFPSCSPTGP